MERGKRPRDDSNPWTASCCPDERRRLEFLGDSKVVISWINGPWEVKGKEHVEMVQDFVDQFVRWYLSGTFRQRTDEADWCRHIYR